MSAAERIWAESVGENWRCGSWAAKPSPQQFPDEQEFVLASVADEDRRQRDVALEALKAMEEAIVMPRGIERGRAFGKARAMCRAAIAECEAP